MKKNYIMTMIAMMLMAIGAYAQSNTYSTIIEMTNGTKFTIGPNDIQNITFNEGQITISGSTIMELIQANEGLKTSVEGNAAATAGNSQKIEAIEAKVDANTTQIATNSTKIDNNGKQIADNSYMVDSLAKKIADMGTSGDLNYVTPARMDSIVKVLRTHQTKIDLMAGYPSWSQVQTQINQYSRQADDAQTKLNSAISDITNIKKEIETLKSRCTALETSVANKADKKDLTALQTTVNNKAEKSDVTALQTTVNNTADKSDVTALQTKAKELSDKIAKLETAVANLQKQ